jgi:MFS family permease
MIRFGIIAILSSFGLGITLPVMNLLILDKGATLSTLALFMGVYSVVIVTTEIPSGMFSDRFGRRMTFIVSKTMMLLGSLFLIFGSSTVSLIGAVLALGLARSFISGSFEALTVDWHNQEFGIDRLHRITSHMAVWDTLGLSGGALSSGFVTLAFQNLQPLETPYLGNFWISSVIQVLVIVLTLSWIKEPVLESSPVEEASQSKLGLVDLVRSRTILPFFILSFAFGFILSSIEKYWQPRLLEITDTDHTGVILLGVISFIGFMAALGGSILAGRLLHKHPKRSAIYVVVFKSIFALSMVAVALATGPMVFTIAYGGFYLFLAISQIPEQTLLNREIPSRMRASLLSVSSFSLQIGGLVSSLFAAIWLHNGKWGIPSLWLIAVILTIISIAPFIKVYLYRGFKL